MRPIDESEPLQLNYNWITWATYGLQPCDSEGGPGPRQCGGVVIDATPRRQGSGAAPGVSSDIILNQRTTVIQSDMSAAKTPTKSITT
ncbi:hypothetical protein E2562_030369 [Oryza meyeriana var. granulata]|uniref:Uncharacterized protein n=1 Tax=Oryza meyeriana var. granulata TaxID=110450 RepID=A0A6G1DR45_9ORYZ|nr:hypothetical protein E2562_030369 [Oryza meyeriana var. granulata]